MCEWAGWVSCGLWAGMGWWLCLVGGWIWVGLMLAPKCLGCVGCVGVACVGGVWVVGCVGCVPVLHVSINATTATCEPQHCQHML